MRPLLQGFTSLDQCRKHTASSGEHKRHSAPAALISHYFCLPFGCCPKRGECQSAFAPREWTILAAIGYDRETSNELRKGDGVRVTAGVFARFSGDVKKVLGDGRIAVSVDVFGLPVAVDVRPSMVERTRDAA